MIFPSIARPDKMGYKWVENPEYHSREQGLCRNATQFQTYGDGLTQHSGEWDVSIDSSEDYLWSLADYLLAHPECISEVSNSWPHNPDKRDLEWYGTVKYKEDKITYYNKSERKVSASDSKRHDKRWEKVERWHDGTIKSIMWFAVQNTYSRLMKFHAIFYTKRYLDERDEEYIYWSDEWSDATEDELKRIYHAWDAVDRQVQAHRMLDGIEYGIERYKRKIEEKKAV